VGAIVVAVAAVIPAAALAAAPANDDFANATAIDPAGGAITGSNVDATAQSGEPDHAGSSYGALHSAWFAWTAPASGPATVSTCGSAFDTRLGVYTGGNVAALTAITSNETSSGPACAGSKFAEAEFDAVGGTTYRIAVDTSGDLAGDGSGPPLGEIKLALDGPDAAPTDDGTNPGEPVTEEAHTFVMPRLRPTDGKKPKFTSLEKARKVVEGLQAAGADLSLTEISKPPSAFDFKAGDVPEGAVLQQSIAPGEAVTTTATNPRVLKLDYYAPAAKPKSWLEALLEELGKALDEAKKKSKCKYVAYDDKRSEILRELNKELPSPYLTEELAAKALKKAGCKYRVTEYFDAPGIKSDFVDEITTVNPLKDEIGLRIGLPVRQDFLLTFRDDPTRTDIDKNTPDGDTMSVGTDGALTASPIRSNVLTVQVIERMTGRLVEGVDVRFIGENGKPAVQRTDGNGETTFSARLVNAGDYSVGASFTDPNGAEMQGFRQIAVKNRKEKPFTTLTGRTLTWHKKGEHYQGNQAELDRARSMPVVPATIGTGLSGEPVSAPRIQQGTALAPGSGGRLVAGQHNMVAIPDDSAYAIGAGPGLIAFGGGIDGSFAKRAGRADARQFPNPFAAIGNFVNGIVTGLSRAFQSNAGTVAQRTSAADQQKIAATAERLAQNGVPAPPSGLISDKGLGVISTGGLNVISTGGLNVISTGGLNLIGQAGGNFIGTNTGNLIGQAGGNLIGQAGGNVIATGGGNFVPVYGGRIISDNGASK
jgi:hypothetical protein